MDISLLKTVRTWLVFCYQLRFCATTLKLRQIFLIAIAINTSIIGITFSAEQAPIATVSPTDEKQITGDKVSDDTDNKKLTDSQPSDASTSQQTEHVQETTTVETTLAKDDTSGEPAQDTTEIISTSDGTAPNSPEPSVSAQTDNETPSNEPVGQAPQPKEGSPAQVSDILEQQSILTPRGMLVIDPQLQYSNSSVTHVTIDGYTVLPALLVGSIDVRSIRRDTVTAAVGLRYGVTNKLETELRIPYVRRDDQTISRPLNGGAPEPILTKLSGSALGDVELATRYQLNNGNNNSPFYVANLRIKSDTGLSPFEVSVDENGLPTELATGTGFWGAQASISFTQPSDPAVFFGGLSYMWNKKRKISDALGVIKPGASAGMNFGMGLALNQNASFNLGYSHNVVQPARQNNELLKGSERLQVGALAIGLSYRTSRNTSFNFGLNIGVTQDAPDVQVSFSLPFNVKLHN